MLALETSAVIKSTIPLLEAHGLEITSVFYTKLFEKNPELKHIFNSSNQRDASQSRALSDAVLAYAKNIDNVELLLPAVKRIANKHASIGIQDHHYPLVGASLVEAIQEVLALDSDHPALSAWAEAYGLLANVFIESESALYNEKLEKTGGWKGFRPFVVSDVINETVEVKSIILQAEDKQPIQEFLAGQYIGVKIPAADNGFDQIRQYSLSSWQKGLPSHYRISVKSENGGKVSPSIHDYKQGDTLLISPPFGDFILNQDVKQKTHVFISGGVGITPLFAMLKQAISMGNNKENLQFIECSRGLEHQIFKDELQQLADKGSVQLKKAFEFGEGGDFSGRLTSEVLNDWITDKSAEIYFCGPLPFMSALKKILLSIGIKESQLHYEVFGPTSEI